MYIRNVSWSWHIVRRLKFVDSGYELIRFDHPSNRRQGGIGIYHKEFLPVKVNDASYLKEFLTRNILKKYSWNIWNILF